MKSNKWLILLAVSIPTFMAEMAGTSVFVAFDAIASDLNVGIDRSVWLTTLYLATNAAMIPLAGWLGKKFGYKTVILLGIGVFTVSALFSALAQSFEALVIFRALQGIGDGPIVPVSTALLLETFPPKERGRMMVATMLAVGMAPALGPFSASWIVEEIGWRGIFYMNVGLGLLSLASVAALIPPLKRPAQDVQLNWPSFAMLAIGTSSLQLFLDRGGHYDWFASDRILGLFIVAVISLLLFFINTIIKKDNSVLDLRLLRDIHFLTGNLAIMLIIGALFGALVVKMIYLQWLMGYTPVLSGIYYAVVAGAMFFCSVLAGVLTDKIHPRWPVVFGLPMCIYSLHLASRLTLYSDLRGILIAGVVMGAGIAFVMVPVSVTVFASIQQKDMAAASVLNSYLSVISGAVSISLVMVLLMRRIEIQTASLGVVLRHGNPVVETAAFYLGEETLLVTLQLMLSRQAAMFSFNDVLYFLTFLPLVILLYLPFMKKAQQEDEPNVNISG